MNGDKLRGGRPQSAPSDWRLIAFGETLGRPSTYTPRQQNWVSARTTEHRVQCFNVARPLLQSWTRTETISCQHREWHAQCFQPPPLRMPHLSLHTSHLFTVKPKHCPSVCPVRRGGGLNVLLNVCHKIFKGLLFPVTLLSNAYMFCWVFLGMK